MRKFRSRDGVNFEICFARFRRNAEQFEVRIARARVGGVGHARAEIDRERTRCENGGEIGAQFQELHAARIGAERGRASRIGAVLSDKYARFRRCERALRLRRINDGRRVFSARRNEERGEKHRGAEI